MENQTTKEAFIRVGKNRVQVLEDIPLIKNLLIYAEQVTGFSHKTLSKQNRKTEIVETRQMLMYCLKEETPYSLASIGYLFEKDHSTVLHSEKAINNLKNLKDPQSRYVKLLVGLFMKFITDFKQKEQDGFDNKELKIAVFERLLAIQLFNEEQNQYWIKKYNDAK